LLLAAIAYVVRLTLFLLPPRCLLPPLHLSSRFSCFLLLALFLVAGEAFLYKPTPGGWVLAHCDYEVPSGAHLKKQTGGGLLVTNPDGFQWTIPVCDTQNGTLPVFKRNVPNANPDSPIPLVYDGWTAYVEFDIPSPGFDTFTGKMNVADKPAKTPQVLYIFPGLQNINWIPVVDPDPTVPFDIIQPVIQYPGDRGTYWSVKSWYVTLDTGTVHSNEIQLDVGDVVFGNMTRTGNTSWYIGSTQTSTGKKTEINVDHDRLQTQPWAYNTIECYGCNGCSTYPLQPELFTELVLTQAGKQITPKWNVNPKPSQMMQCKEMPVVVSASEVDVHFQ